MESFALISMTSAKIANTVVTAPLLPNHPARSSWATLGNGMTKAIIGMAIANPTITHDNDKLCCKSRSVGSLAAITRFLFSPF